MLKDSRGGYLCITIFKTHLVELEFSVGIANGY